MRSYLRVFDQDEVDRVALEGSFHFTRRKELKQRMKASTFQPSLNQNVVLGDAAFHYLEQGPKKLDSASPGTFPTAE
jgi:hypothetical protein